MTKIWLLTMIFYIPCSAFSQKVSLIPVAGFNLSEVDSSPMGQVRTTLKPGWQAGALISFNRPGKFSFLTGLSYTQKGFTSKTGGLWSGISSQDHEFTYLEVPLLARLSLGSSGTRFFIDGGLYAAHWLNYTITSTNPARDMGKVDLNNGLFRKSDYGLIGGIGIKRQIGFGEVMVSLRYTYGLRSQIDYNEYPLQVKPMRNRVGSVILGYAIPISK